MAEARRLNQLAAEIEAVADLPAGPVAVALSGGADSAALLWICTRLTAGVRAIHVDHSLPASPLMAETAVEVAGRLGVELEMVTVELGTGPSPENQARIVRYEALAAAARKDEWVLTAHTSDDQAETMIDRLLRASGLDGLGGIPRRRPPFARPFLRVPRAATRELATLAGLPWRDDPANLDPEPLRNRIRTRLLPELEAGYNRRIRQSLATTASLVAAEVEYLEGLVGAITSLR